MREEGAWPWPRNAWYQIAWDSELGDAPLARTIMNEKVVVFRGPDGKAAVLEDRCCHRAAPLSMGNIQPTGLQCGYHGLIFDGDGKCVWIPGQDSIPPQARVKAYPTVERQEFVWVWMGAPEKADPSLIVDYPWNDDHATWPHKHGMYEVKCNYMLLIDNLMDLTHIPFIHRKTIGGGVQMEQVNADVAIKRTEHGVHYMRWMLNHTPPPTYSKAANWGRRSRSTAGRNSNISPRAALSNGPARWRSAGAPRKTATRTAVSRYASTTVRRRSPKTPATISGRRPTATSRTTPRRPRSCTRRLPIPSPRIWPSWRASRTAFRRISAPPSSTSNTMPCGSMPGARSTRSCGPKAAPLQQNRAEHQTDGKRQA